jgi:hypothetical protein
MADVFSSDNPLWLSINNLQRKGIPYEAEAWTRTPVPVLLIKDGQVMWFASKSGAAKAIGSSSGNIEQAIRHRCKCKGWEVVEDMGE